MCRQHLSDADGNRRQTVQSKQGGNRRQLTQLVHAIHTMTGAPRDRTVEPPGYLPPTIVIDTALKVYATGSM